MKIIYLVFFSIIFIFVAAIYYGYHFYTLTPKTIATISIEEPLGLFTQAARATIKDECAYLLLLQPIQQVITTMRERYPQIRTMQADCLGAAGWMITVEPEIPAVQLQDQRFVTNRHTVIGQKLYHPIAYKTIPVLTAAQNMIDENEGAHMVQYMHSIPDEIASQIRVVWHNQDLVEITPHDSLMSLYVNGRQPFAVRDWQLYQQIVEIIMRDYVGKKKLKQKKIIDVRFKKQVIVR